MIRKIQSFRHIRKFIAIFDFNYFMVTRVGFYIIIMSGEWAIPKNLTSIRHRVTKICYRNNTQERSTYIFMI